MDTVVKIIAVAFILMGVLFAAYPQSLKRLIALVGKGIRIYFIGLIRLALAVRRPAPARESYFRHRIKVSTIGTSAPESRLVQPGKR